MAQQHKLGKRNTTVSRTKAGIVRVTYHSTDVVTVYPSGTVVLDTGGWRTATTKTRMNQAANQLELGFSVHQQDYDWFVSFGENRWVKMQGTGFLLRSNLTAETGDAYEMHELAEQENSVIA